MLKLCSSLRPATLCMQHSFPCPCSLGLIRSWYAMVTALSYPSLGHAFILVRRRYSFRARNLLLVLLLPWEV